MYEEELKALDEDQWEQFAQDFLFHIGFSVLIGPSVGADDGLDMVVLRGETKYLVSCKHYLTSGKNIGVSNEIDISDRVKRHGCGGFIAFYSTGPTSGLKRKFQSLGEQGIEILEIYKSDVFDVMPTMMGFVLQKYFKRPQDISHHINDPSKYKPLHCMKRGCNKDILDKKNINLSMASLVKKDNELHLLFGCKNCINHIPDEGWAEITQLRYIEELVGWRSLMDTYFQKGVKPGEKFFPAWAQLQEGVVQVLIPPGWGRWLG